MSLFKNGSLKGWLEASYLSYWCDQDTLIRPWFVKIAVMRKHEPVSNFAMSQNVLLLIGLTRDSYRVLRPPRFVVAQ